MKLFTVNGNEKVFAIKNEKEYQKILKLKTRLEDAIKKTGFYYTFDVPEGVVQEAKDLDILVMNSLMNFSSGNTEYAGGHAYGEKIR